MELKVQPFYFQFVDLRKTELAEKSLNCCQFVQVSDKE